MSRPCSASHRSSASAGAGASRTRCCSGCSEWILNDDAWRTRAELRGTHGGHLQLHSEWLQIARGQRERRSRVSADDLIAGGVRVGTIVEQNELALAGRRYTRERAELFLQPEPETASS